MTCAHKLTRQRSIPVVEADGRLVGVVSRTDLLNPVRHGVYLVDHNERSQTVDGLDEAELLGIVDHHRIADIQTAVPILFRNDIVGSTSTIIAGLLRGGRPRHPALDRRHPAGRPDHRYRALSLANHHAARPAAWPRCWPRWPGWMWKPLAAMFFSVASDLSGRTPREIVTTDFKEFRIDEVPFAIGYLETVHKQRVDEIRDGLLAEMQAIRDQKGYASLLLMIVDIVHGETEILIQGMEQAVAEALGQSLVAPHTVIVGGVLSRKKQIVPILPIVARRWRGRS